MDKFEVEVLSKSTTYDPESADGKGWIITNYVLKLNYVALNEWIRNTGHGCREDYDTDEEYNAYVSDLEERRESWKKKIACAIGFTGDRGIKIVQVLAEFFAVNIIQKFK